MSTAETRFYNEIPDNPNRSNALPANVNIYETPCVRQQKHKDTEDTTVKGGLIALAIFLSMNVGLVVFGLVIITQLQSEMKILEDQLTHQGDQSFARLKWLEENGNFTVVEMNITGGVFDIYPESRAKPVEVYCDIVTDGGGWIVFQRRMDGTEDFYRGWNDYVSGFGEKDKEMWLGLETIYQLTKDGSFELRVDLEDFNGTTVYAKYGIFSISSASENYALLVGEYSGTAGDSLTYHTNMQFSTKDSDNDRELPGNCAIARRGAWWYNQCYHSNLNGMYYQYGQDTVRSVNWYHWKSNHQSLKFSEMKFRKKT
uniref:microfibril-associated glycoprotein 4-like n=1 Tax=Styela clava TaxID=7725 RepID=UPI0019393D78|nr:microfibril-associated glycoprotein 4-like [Styela clava]